MDDHVDVKPIFMDETGFSDPLGNCDEFNIIQFVTNEGENFNNGVEQGVGQVQQSVDGQKRGQQVQQGQQRPQQVQQRLPQGQQRPQQVQPRPQQPILVQQLVQEPPFLIKTQPTSAGLVQQVVGMSSSSSSISPNSDSSTSSHYVQQQPFIQHNQRVPNALNVQIPGMPVHQPPHMTPVLRQPFQQTQLIGNQEYSQQYLPQASNLRFPQQELQPDIFNPLQQLDGLEIYLSQDGVDDFQDILENFPTPEVRKKRKMDGNLQNPRGFAKSSFPKSYQCPMANTASCSQHSDSEEENEEDPSQKRLNFYKFQEKEWLPIYNQQGQQIPHLFLEIWADKGFTHFHAGNCFVNLKKNHFQITCHVHVEQLPRFVNINGQLRPIQGFKLGFTGVRADMITSDLPINQSQSDRKQIKHEPVDVPLESNDLTKCTVQRLHFSKATDNNSRKNGKLHPDQKYYLLVVQLFAVLDNNNFVVMQKFCSDKIIVRASSTGKIEENEVEGAWKKNGNVLSYGGSVAIGTDKCMDNAKLSVMGNIVTTGSVSRPSDRRVKEDIVPVDTKEALDRISQMRIVEYAYKPEFAQEWGLSEEDRHRVGVIAQEVAEQLPDAVKNNGPLYTVDETRIFYEGFAAAQELGRLYGTLDCRVDKVKQIADILAKDAKRRRQLGASMASGMSGLSKLLREEEVKELSESNTSLNSISQSIGPSASQVQPKYQRLKSSNYNSQPLCNSRLTQIAILVLVFVMSFCLLTMCSLYVLDWYNRTYVYSTHPSRLPPTPSPMLDNIIDLTKQNWAPPDQPHLKPLLSTCSSTSQHCPHYCCATSLAYNKSETDELDQVNSFVSLPNLTNEHAKVEFMAERDQNTVESFGTGVDIKLLEFGMYLDQRFCVEGSCDRRKGRYNLYVPVSTYMPTIPLQVKFSVKPGMFVDDCGALRGFKHIFCEIEADSKENTNIQPSMFKIDAKTFQISAGDFMQSAYRFRVGLSTGLCEMGEDQQGRSFDEYNLVFYRKCI